MGSNGYFLGNYGIYMEIDVRFMWEFMGSNGIFMRSNGMFIYVYRNYI